MENTLDKIFAFLGNGNFPRFPSREVCWARENELITLYREHGNEDAYMQLLHYMIPIIRGTTYRNKFTDVEEFKLVCIEVFHKCILEYEISDDVNKMLFSGYYKMNLRFAMLDHLNHYVEDREVVKPLEFYEEELAHSEYSEEADIDFKIYLALDKLTKRERQVITMHFLEGKGKVEIIQELGIKESSFPVYLSNAKKAFKKAYLEVMELDLLQLPDEEMEM